MTFRMECTKKIKLIRELTCLLTSNLLHVLKQKLLKLLINCINPRYTYVQHLE